MPAYPSPVTPTGTAPSPSRTDAANRAGVLHRPTGLVGTVLYVSRTGRAKVHIRGRHVWLPTADLVLYGGGAE